MSTPSAEPISDLYSRRILRLAADIPRLGRLAAPHGTATATSPLCGSVITVDVVLDGETISEFAHEVKACALGQTAASILGREVVGSSVTEIAGIAEAMRAMLKADADPPGGRWTDLEVLIPVREFRQRHGSVLLPFDATLKAIAAATAAQKEAT